MLTKLPVAPLDDLEAKKHRLVCKRFEQLGRNDRGVEARPSVIHFGGYEIHHEHCTQVRVLNTSSQSTRLTILPPATKFFRIEYEKKGLLAPGMSEEITIIFTPLEWRYYYDTVKVFCDNRREAEGANVLIPIHGYPSVNELKVPRFIDFGNVPRGRSRTKVIPLSSNIPIEFEFEITIKQNHEDFAVTPMRGIIPANGTLNVAVTFVPVKSRTCLMTLLFNAAQFDFTEVQVDIMGNSMEDAFDDTEIEEAREEKRREDIRKRVQKLMKKKRSGKWKAIEVQLPTFPTATASLDGVSDAHRKTDTAQEADGTDTVTPRSCGSDATVPAEFMLEKKSDLEQYTSDMMGLRTEVIESFVNSGSKPLSCLETSSRLKGLSEAVALLRAKERAATEAWFETEETEKEETETERVKPPEFVLAPVVPVAVQALSSGSTDPVECMPCGNFIEFVPLPLVAKDDYKVEDYAPIAPPPPAQYMRKNADRSPYLGALEENYVRGPCGDAFDGAEKPLTRPESCLRCPVHDPMTDVCIPSPDVRVWVGTPYDYTETDLEYRLSLPIPVRPWKTEPRFVLSQLEMIDDPLIAHWRTTRALMEPLGVHDPAGESLAVGREKCGPMVGGGCTGGSWTMLPPGGNSEDVPSDTDSDDRDNEWDVPGPPADYMNAYFEPELIPKLSADAEITNDRWAYSDALEQKLEEEARARNEALRVKLTEFNALLDYPNKLYLG